MKLFLVSGQAAALRGGACVARWPPSICHEPECDNSIIIPIHHSALSQSGRSAFTAPHELQSIKEGGCSSEGTLLPFGFTLQTKLLNSPFAEYLHHLHHDSWGSSDPEAHRACPVHRQRPGGGPGVRQGQRLPHRGCLRVRKSYEPVSMRLSAAAWNICINNIT